MRDTIVIALGGNAILRPGQFGSLAEQTQNIRAACEQIAAIAAQGHRVVITHGNGPQVGNILLQNEAVRNQVPAMPLDMCVAQSQGLLGCLIQRELQTALAWHHLQQPVVCVVTQVVVDPLDPAFAQPTKPVGPFYSAAEARERTGADGWEMREDSGRGWRRVVASPQPQRIVELAAVRGLLDAGAIVVACGGGGVPVVKTRQGLHGVEAVIDKDLAARTLAIELRADHLLILTDVPQVYIHWGTPDQRALEQVTVSEALRYLAAGHFGVGSMEAKVQAAVSFLQAGGRQATIAALTNAGEAVAGREGTQFVGTPVPASDAPSSAPVQ